MCAYTRVCACVVANGDLLLGGNTYAQVQGFAEGRSKGSNILVASLLLS